MTTRVARPSFPDASPMGPAASCRSSAPVTDARPWPCICMRMRTRFLSHGEVTEKELSGQTMDHITYYGRCWARTCTARGSANWIQACSNVTLVGTTQFALGQYAGSPRACLLGSRVRVLDE